MATDFLDKAAIDSIIVQQLRAGLASLDSKQPESVISVYLHQSLKYLLSLSRVYIDDDFQRNRRGMKCGRRS